jgi:CheY-like chemotaxis protein
MTSRPPTRPPPLTPEERQRVLSIGRLELALTSFALVLLIVVGGLVSVLVTRELEGLAAAAGGTADLRRAQRAVLGACIGGAAFGFVLWLVFVRLYVAPLARAVEAALRKLEATARQPLAAPRAPESRPGTLPPGAEAPLPRSAGKPQVLVADADLREQQALSDAFVSCGCAVDRVASGSEALEAMTRSDYELVLLDGSLPDFDGYETARRIRAGGAGARLPVILMSGRAVAGERAKAILAGMDDLVTKPVSEEAIQALCRRWLPRVAEDAAAEAPVLDPELRQNSGVVSLFLGFSRLHIEALLEAAGSGNLARVQDRARKLRGSALSVGARALADLCSELEAEPSRAALLHEIVHAHDLVLRELGRGKAAS